MCEITGAVQQPHLDEWIAEKNQSKDECKEEQDQKMKENKSNTTAPLDYKTIIQIDEKFSRSVILSTKMNTKIRSKEMIENLRGDKIDFLL